VTWLEAFKLIVHLTAATLTAAGVGEVHLDSQCGMSGCSSADIVEGSSQG